jgi:phosphoglycerate dehydrogenase-like enzyme
MNILIDENFYKSNVVIEYLRLAGYSVKFLDTFKHGQVDILICNQNFIINNYDLINKNNIKFIQLISSGYEKLDFDLLNPNILIANARGIYSKPISEYIISIILFHFKRLNRFFHTSNYSPSSFVVSDISELKVVILGDGSISNEVSRLLRAFNCKVNVIYRTYKSHFDKSFLPLSELSSSLEHSDVFVITSPLNKDSNKIVKSHFINTMNDNGLIINVARSEIIDFHNLNDILTKKKIKLITDVLNETELRNETLNNDNLIFTSHSSWHSENNIDRLIELIGNNIQNYSNCSQLQNEVIKDDK